MDLTCAKDTMPSVSSWNLTAVIWGRAYEYPHFIGGETATQRMENPAYEPIGWQNQKSSRTPGHTALNPWAHFQTSPGEPATGGAAVSAPIQQQQSTLVMQMEHLSSRPWTFHHKNTRAEGCVAHSISKARWEGVPPAKLRSTHSIQFLGRLVQQTRTEPSPDVLSQPAPSTFR